MKRTLKAIPVAALMLAGATAAGLAAAEGWPARTREAPTTRDVFSGNCTGLTDISYKTNSTDGSVVAFGSFVNVPNSGVNFTQTSAGCVIITFSAEALSPGDRNMLVRVRLDSSQTAEPRDVFFGGDDNFWPGARSFSFVFPNVSAGAHTVTIQFRNAASNSAVQLGRRTTIVQHR